MTTTDRDPRAEPSAPRRQYLVEGALTRFRSFTRRDVDRWLEWPSHEDPLYSPYNPLTLTGSQRDAWYEDWSIARVSSRTQSILRLAR